MSTKKNKMKYGSYLSKVGYFGGLETNSTDMFRPIPIENASAHKFASPSMSAYFVDMLAPMIPATIATVVMTPSIPP